MPYTSNWLAFIHFNQATFNKTDVIQLKRNLTVIVYVTLQKLGHLSLVC